MERAQLSAARHKKHWSLEEAAERLGVDKATLQRWEKGKSMPQAVNLRKLCEVYEMTAWELGLEDEHPVVTQNTTLADQGNDALAAFRQQDLTMRFMRSIWNWPKQNARYHELQTLIALELEDNTSMNHDELVSRRDALRRLALLPIEVCGLSALIAVMKRPVEEILTQCASGIMACWYLRQGRELAFANDAVSKYIPILQEITQSAASSHRKAAAGLLAQCFLLKTSIANHIDAVGSNIALHYAQQAEGYSEMAGSLQLQILAVRMQANAYDYAERWKQALVAAEKAKYLIETNKRTHPTPPFIASFIYAGLANYQGHNGHKQDALRSLGDAYTMFFTQASEKAASDWFPINHSQANLLLHNGLIHFYLGDFKEACVSFVKIRNVQEMPQTTRIEALIDQVLAELQREDAPRDMDSCIDCWTQGMQGAIVMQSERWFNEARTAYMAMRAAWPAEKRIKDLREHVVHW